MVRQQRGGQGAPEPERKQARSAETDPGRRQPHDEGPVPEVQAVADRAEPSQQPQRQHTSQCRLGCEDRCNDHEGRRQAGGDEAPAIQQGRLSVECDPRRRDRHGDDATCDREPVACRWSEVVEATHGHGSDRAEQDRCHADVGSVIVAQGIERIEDDLPPSHRRQCAESGGQAHARGALPPPPSTDDQRRQHDQWPDDVELLLDRQRPHVAQRRERIERRPVVDADVNLLPIEDVRGRRDRLVAQIDGALAAIDDPSLDDHDGRQQHAERREQALGPARPERAEGDRRADAGRLIGFVDE